MAMVKPQHLRSMESFGFQPGRVLARKYKVITRLGGGWEGEVYLVRERSTAIERAAKFFFPRQNLKDRAVNFYARKLHRLRACPIVIQYHTHETITYRGTSVTFLVSDFVEGELLSDFLARQPGRRIPVFPALHLLHSLACGIECIHRTREYHGDLHPENIIVQRYGLGFDLKLLDLFHWGACRPENIHDDVVDLVRIFYDAVGGRRYYAKQPQQVKDICRGLKRSLILKNFRSAGQLREYLQTLTW